MTALLAIVGISAGCGLLAALTFRVWRRARRTGVPCTKSLVRETEARLSLVGWMLLTAGLTTLAVLAVTDA